MHVMRVLWDLGDQTGGRGRREIAQADMVAY
jgi:stress-induced morphogen